MVDGDLLKYTVEGGAYFRKEFFGKDSELIEMVKDFSDEDLEGMLAGGHDPLKMYSAYNEAMNCKGKPTAILARTIKGYGLGDAGEGRNITHNQKKLNTDQLLYFRDRFEIPLSDSDTESAEFYQFSKNSKEYKQVESHLDSKKLNIKSLISDEEIDFQRLIDDFKSNIPRLKKKVNYSNYF